MVVMPAPDLAPPTGWSLVDGRLHRVFDFGDFSEAFAFMTRVALLAERLDHHPNWSNVYSQVIVDLWSHDADAITDRDIELAESINDLVDPR